MFFNTNFWLVVITILFFNFSYGSINVKPNYEKFEIGEKVTISWDLNKKVNNATLSYYSIKNFKNNGKNFKILNNIFERTSDYTWEIPKKLENDIGYFIIWSDDDRLIERTSSILIINASGKINKREVEGEGEGEGEVEGEVEVVNEEEKPSNDNEATNSGSNSNSSNDSGSSESKSNSSKINSLSVNTSEPLTPISSDSQINNISEDTRETAIQSKFNEFMENNKDYIYYIVGGGILAVLVAVLIAFKLFGRKNEIPNGKRSIKRFTIHEDMVPPISMYNDSWKNTMSKSKSFNTLSKNNTKKSLDSETEQLINNGGDSLINDAEKFAREHGLTDKEWVARKDYIPYREDELEIYEGNRIKVYELYDDLWCYGMNLDHYGTLNNDNEGMFPSSILPISVITKLLNATGKNTNNNGSDTTTTADGTNEKNNNTQYEVTIDVSSTTNNNSNPNIIVTPEDNKDARESGSQFALPKPLSVPLVPLKALPVIPNLNRSTSLRSSVHRKRNSNIIDPGKSPLIKNNKRRGSQLSNISNEIEVPTITTTKPRTSLQNKLLFISTNNQKESKNEDAKALLGSPESDSQSKSIDDSITSQNINSNNININNNNINKENNLNNIGHNNLKQKQPIESSTQNIIATENNDNSIDKRKDEIYQQQLLIQKQREQLQKQQIEQQKLQEQLKQQQLQQQLQQQEIQKQLQQLQQMQQEKERQILQQKQQLQQQIQQQQIEQQQLRIQREKQQIIQKSKLKEIEYERERLLQASLMKQDDRDNTLPSYSEAINNNFASSSNSSEMVDGFPLPPQVNNNFMANTSKSFTSPVLNSKSEDENPELYPRNTSYKHQIEKRDKAPEVYPRNISKAYVDEHPSIGRKIKQKKPEGSSSQKMSLKEKEASNMNYQ